MFTTGYITGGGVRPQHKCEVSQDRTSQSFALFRQKDDGEDDGDDDGDDGDEGDGEGDLMMRRMEVPT